ncbi:uncharacterized protein LOC122854171 [Aphidius gifuensis]|uniref:uncharacterized protein LOC122854171 n=1 Tax=Aphidius gifuensis TaxID=684658 RepID=UPI001CDC1914|nr:uncharacterized protein LOC122854171 [Aphidius gifuensis]XP_044010550.1 uncharacterized protein LOC122854171 [Aphidius gifuensis]
MSADSPRRGLHKGAQIISPQPISDKSIIDSVAGIINDIVPQAYTSTPSNDNKEAITWARFEFADTTNTDYYSDFLEISACPPLILVLGYATGVQVWLVGASGEATEVLSWRQGVVRTLRILPNPKLDDEHQDLYEKKRPIVAICDSSGSGTQFCNVSFVSLRTGEQVKNIKFKNQVCDVLANRKTIVVTFIEKIAVFDSRKFDDILTVTTCYLSPGPNQNPIALGTRWLAYSEKKLLPTRRSSGGSEGEGVQSYTATVLYAAKSLGKGLRGLGETVASSLTGNNSISNQLNIHHNNHHNLSNNNNANNNSNNSGGGGSGSSNSHNNSNNININDTTQPGVVTILDLQAAKDEKEYDDSTIETVVAHFTAHNDAIVSMTFDLTGAILMTADRRGHDFHVFRIQPHPGGPTLAAVHHLYVLHRGDTTAKVQDMIFSSDTRWAAVSTVRGTTHVFPVAPYGGQIGMRTHSTSHVVNRLSRFHRSAGLTDDTGTRSHSPVSHNEIPISVYPYNNPRLPPYPHPTIIHPLAQIRQPSKLQTTNCQLLQTNMRTQQQRQRLHSDDNNNNNNNNNNNHHHHNNNHHHHNNINNITNGSLPLKICALFAPSRTWAYNTQRDSTTSKINNTKRAIDSLFIMACHGNMIQYDLEPKPATGIPKEKICDDTMIELEVEAKGQWPLLRLTNSIEIIPPLPQSNPLLVLFGNNHHFTNDKNEQQQQQQQQQQMDTAEDRWLSQVEIVTHAGPHRRLWMGPQFVFKTYNAPSGVNLSESEAVEIGVTGGSRPARSNPVNMPHSATAACGTRPLVPVIIDGSGSSYEQSPRFMEVYGDSLENDSMGSGHGENQLREDLAEAMLETSTAPNRVPGRRLVVERVGQPVTKVVNPLGTVITVLADEEDANTNQEYNDIEDTHQQAPRSLCAEEGPASLSDIEQDGGCPLRNLTKICAEMRHTNESTTIDTISDDNIHEIKINKNLCIAMNNNSNSNSNTTTTTIDYEKTDSFHDISTNLSLCVEQGEIVPTSSMTQLHDNYWSKKNNKLQNNNNNSNSNITNAKYVVNYDEDSVVLMENKTSDNKIIKNIDTTERATKRPNKQITSTTRATKRVTSSQRELPKYHLHENDDSIIIEMANSKATPPPSLPPVEVKNKQQFVKINNNDKKLKTVEAMIIDSKQLINNNIEPIESFVDLKTIDDYQDYPEALELIDDTTTASLRPIIDDFHCMDYHIINTKENTYANKSDDDIEHIFNTDNTLLVIDDDNILTVVDNNVDDINDSYNISQNLYRKCSKSTISDDDLEHIQKSEISELYEGAKAIIIDKNIDNLDNDDDDDDEIEHIVHNEGIDDTILSTASTTPGTSTPQSVPSPLPGSLPPPSINDPPPSTTAKIQTAKLFTDKKQQRNSRKRKDVVVIDTEPILNNSNNNNNTTDVTVIVNTLGTIDEKKLTNNIKNDTTTELTDNNKDKLIDQLNLQSLPKKTKVRTSKTATATTATNIQQKVISNCIEIIDIDAMEKAEMTVNNIVNIPECKILEQCPDISLTRHKKSRKNKKINNDHLLSSTSSKQQCDQQQATIISNDNDNDDVKNWDKIVHRPILTPTTVDVKLTDEISIDDDDDNTKTVVHNDADVADDKVLENVENKIPIIEEKSPSVEEITTTKSDDDDKIEIMNKKDDKKIVNNDQSEVILKTSDQGQGMSQDNATRTEEQHVGTPMDTEDDTVVKDIAEKPTTATTTTPALPPSWSSVAKKNNRSKKKKRR